MMNFQYSAMAFNYTNMTDFSFCPRSSYNRAPRGYEFLHDQWREVAVPHVQESGSFASQQAKGTSYRESVKIASVLLRHCKPEEISLEVDSEKVILHGQHRFAKEGRFEKRELKRVFKIPQGVDPATVTSRITQDNGALIIEGMKHVEKKANGDKFEVKLDFRGCRQEEIKIQLRRNELTVTGKHISEHHLSRDYSRRILLPDDVDLGSVTSHLTKEGFLTIKATRDPQRFNFTLEIGEPSEKTDQRTNVDAFGTANYVV